MEARYRYTVLLENDQRRQLAPLGIDKLKITGKREGQNIFFRRKLQGSLTLVGDDYNFFYELENSPARCGYIRLQIERFCGGVYVDYWRGIFTLSDCKFNLDACQIVLNGIEPDDTYRVILENYSRDHNILNVAPAGLTVNTRLDLAATFEFRRITGDAIGEQEDAETWATFLKARNWIDGRNGTNGTKEHNDVIFRLIRTAPFITIGGVSVASDLSREGWKTISEDVVAKTARYAKAPNLYQFKPYEYQTKRDWYNKYADLQQKAPGEGWDQLNFIEVTGATQAFSAECNPLLNLRYYVNERRCKRLIWQLGAFSFSRGRRLLDALDYLVNETAPASRAASPTAQSLFFTEATNYVTRLPNDLLDLLIFQKTDVLGSTSTERATKGEISLKNLLDDLQNMFQVYWFLDAAGKFRLEHLSYFQDQGVNDLTAKPSYARYLAGTRAYEYNKEAMPRYERLLFTESFGDDFLKAEIEYTDPCVNKQFGQDSAETTVSRFNNDLKGLLTGGSTSNNGFTLIAHRNGTVIKTAGALTGKLHPNAPLSAANLVQAYWRHGRVLLSGKANGSFTRFASTAKNRKQAAITVPECCEAVNPYAKFVTTLGNAGSLESWVEIFEPTQLSFVVLHSAPAATTSGPARTFNDSFSDAFS